MKKLITLLFVISITTVEAQNDNTKVENPYLLLGRYVSIYKKYKLAKPLEMQYVGSKYERDYNDFIFTQASFIGKFKESMEYFDKICNEQEPKEVECLKDYELVEFNDVIDSLSKNNQIIIINEAHHIPMHRTNTLRMLNILYKNGFRYLACETLANWPSIDSSLNARKYPINNSGYYTNEPVFGDLVRQALKQGYETVSYEPVNYRVSFPGVNDRDSLMAVSIVWEILKKDPDAKILIHVGYGHVYETTSIENVHNLSYYLKQMTGIDPLTIDQQRHMEHFSGNYETSEYKFIADSLQIAAPTILRKPDGAFWGELTDINLVNPRTEFNEFDRPIWLYVNNKENYIVPDSILVNYPLPFLIKARLFSESDDAVPIDQIEITSSKEKAALVLYKKEKYSIELENPEGEIIDKYVIDF